MKFFARKMRMQPMAKEHWRITHRRKKQRRWYLAQTTNEDHLQVLIRVAHAKGHDWLTILVYE